MALDKAFKARWVKALRSGRYKQAKGALHRKNGAYCCLGVGARLVGAGRGALIADGGQLGLTWLASVGLRKSQAEKLARMNDNGATFAEIADYIEKRFCR